MRLGRTLLRIALVSFCSIAAPHFLFAAPHANADSTSVATLDGVVTDSLDQPVAGVEIFVSNATLKSTTNSVGAFSLHGIPPGAVTFGVRKIGYGGGQFTLAMDPRVYPLQ